MFIYEQKSGKFMLDLGPKASLLGVGYSGSQAGRNDPSQEHRVGRGPITQGRYLIRERGHERFAPPAFILEPSLETAQRLRNYGRGGFWIHGDNATGTASTGCIVLARTIREVIRGLDRLIDEPMWLSVVPGV